MKYTLLTIGIRSGEYEFESKSLHKSKGKFDVKNYAMNFYGDREMESDDEPYYFNGGEIACWVQDVKEVTLSEYKVLQKYI